ncbi:MAG TPA: hypothetical protein DDW65_21645 [Firmicutes bacterium]|jgi:hypothetical protein|nr:hypothetical protein [Bacillota bacterium]
MDEKVITVEFQVILDLQKQIGILIGQNAEMMKTNSRIENTLDDVTERIINLENKDCKDEGAKQIKNKSADRRWEISRHAITAGISVFITWVFSKVFH